jgi:hypothetical protein
MQYLGIQDAPRKFRPQLQDQAGPWTGTIFKIDGATISKTVSQEKWTKGRDIISNLANLLDDHPFECPLIIWKDLERETGFLNHLSMTFDGMTSFLKGFYLTLKSWRPKRDGKECKMSDKAWMGCLVAQLENGAFKPQQTCFDKYHVYRSFRRGSESRAVSKEVSPGDQYQVNRWRKRRKGGSNMSQPIDQLHVNVTLAKEAFLRYTRAM